MSEIKIKGLNAEQVTEATNWMTQSFEEGQDENAIMMGLINSGIPVNRVNQVYTAIGKATGLIKTKAQIEEAIDGALSTADVEAICKDYPTFQEETAKIAADTGASEGKVRYELRLAAKGMGIDTPKKPSAGPGARVGQVNRTFVSCFNDDPKVSKQGVLDALDALEGVKNTKTYLSSLYIPFYAVANGLSVEDAIAETKEDKIEA